MAHRKRIAIISLLILAAVALIPIAADQIKLETARSEIEGVVNAELPPGTDLVTAMEYLERNRYFPDYVERANAIDAVRGYDVPSLPITVGRRIFVVGHLDRQRRVVRWDVTADRIFIPWP
jgi:hypothetical protein